MDNSATEMVTVLKFIIFIILYHHLGYCREISDHEEWSQEKRKNARGEDGALKLKAENRSQNTISLLQAYKIVLHLTILCIEVGAVRWTLQTHIS